MNEEITRILADSVEIRSTVSVPIDIGTEPNPGDWVIVIHGHRSKVARRVLETLEGWI